MLVYVLFIYIVENINIYNDIENIENKNAQDVI